MSSKRRRLRPRGGAGAGSDSAARARRRWRRTRASSSCGRAGPAPRYPTLPRPRASMLRIWRRLAEVGGPGGLWRKPKTSRADFTDHTANQHTTKGGLPTPKFGQTL
eukprot:gene15680-biopygen14276